jgi:hypothetical protein
MIDKNLTKDEIIKQQSDAIDDCLIKVGLLQKEIEWQIQRRKLAQQTRNWVIILAILGHLIYWIW